jgi:hypothetical protein
MPPLLKYLNRCTPCAAVFKLSTLERNLKPTQYLFYLLVAPVGLFCFLHWGWIFYSPLADRAGVVSSKAEGVLLSIVVNRLYSFLVAVASLIFLLTPIGLMIKRKGRQLSQLYSYFLWFVLFVVVSQIGLSFLFAGKG